MPLEISPKAIVDHRIYTIRLRKMGEFVEVFDRLAMPILLATLGTPHDVTLHELRIESFFPANESTANWFRARANPPG